MFHGRSFIIIRSLPSNISPQYHTIFILSSYHQCFQSSCNISTNITPSYSISSSTSTSLLLLNQLILIHVRTTTHSVAHTYVRTIGGLACSFCASYGRQQSFVTGFEVRRSPSNKMKQHQINLKNVKLNQTKSKSNEINTLSRLFLLTLSHIIPSHPISSIFHCYVLEYIRTP